MSPQLIDLSMYYVGIKKVIEMQRWASLSNLMSRQHFVFSKGLDCRWQKRNLQLDSHACRVALLCKVPLGRRAWTNLLWSSAQVHWFKHVLGASELPGGAGGLTPAPSRFPEPAPSWEHPQHPYPKSYRYTGSARGQRCTLRQTRLFIAGDTREVLSRSRLACTCTDAIY